MHGCIRRSIHSREQIERLERPIAMGVAESLGLLDFCELYVLCGYEEGLETGK